MDPSWFSLATSEALIVSWAGWPQKSVHDIEPTIDIGGQSIEHTDAASSSLQIDHISGKGKIVLKSRARSVILMMQFLKCREKCNYIDIVHILY